VVHVSVRVRLDFGPDCAIGPGKIALLEAVGRLGSLSQAARDLDMSYRRAWLLLDALNHAFEQPVAELTIGGRGGGGAVVTPFGASLIDAYHSLDTDIGRLAIRALAPFAKRVSAGSRASTVPRRPLKKSDAPSAPATRTRQRAS